MKKKILITGGAGYIGSHISLQLLQAGYAVTVMDNLSNSSRVALDRVQELTGQALLFVEGDVNDAVLLPRLFAQTRFDAVIHFTGLKAVGESVAQPLRYYRNNVAGTLTLLEAMGAADCRSLVFSSSATVYGDPQRLPITEDTPRSATNFYGRSKLIEELLEDVYKFNPRWRIACLRYFNSVDADTSGLIGEDPQGIPNNLLQFISQLARVVQSKLALNLGTRHGASVRNTFNVFEAESGHSLCSTKSWRGRLTILQRCTRMRKKSNSFLTGKPIRTSCTCA
jgi:UDP-glucose 4-epimerase